jgi:hypothetical protein
MKKLLFALAALVIIGAGCNASQTAKSDDAITLYSDANLGVKFVVPSSCKDQVEIKKEGPTGSSMYTLQVYAPISKDEEFLRYSEAHKWFNMSVVTRKHYDNGGISGDPIFKSDSAVVTSSAVPRGVFLGEAGDNPKDVPAECDPKAVQM